MVKQECNQDHKRKQKTDIILYRVDINQDSCLKNRLAIYITADNLHFALRNVFSIKLQPNENVFVKKQNKTVVTLETSHLFLNGISEITDLQDMAKVECHRLFLCLFHTL